MIFGPKGPENIRETMRESGRCIDALKQRGRVLKKSRRVLKKRRRVLQKGGGGFLRRFFFFFTGTTTNGYQNASFSKVRKVAILIPSVLVPLWALLRETKGFFILVGRCDRVLHFMGCEVEGR